MKTVLRIIVATLMLALAAAPAMAGEGKGGIPKKMSEFEGWHGARIEKTEDYCKVVLARDFGKTPADMRLLQQLTNHDREYGRDLDCLAPYTAAWEQMRLLAVEDQNRAAAEFIVAARAQGRLDHMGEFAESFGELYLFPVLQKYNKVAELIPAQKEAGVATEVCLTYYNPSTGELDFKGLIKRLKANNMQSLVSKIEHECARIKKQEAN